MSKGTTIVPLLPMGTLLAMSLDELFGLAKASVTHTAKTKEAVNNGKASIPAVGKVVAALKKRFNQEQDNPLIATLTFAEFWTLKTGEKRVNNHAESCGKCFGAYVENQLITEKDYDLNPADNLEKAAAIITATEGDLTRAEVSSAAKVLQERPKDAAKQLQALIETLKGPKTIDGEKAREYLDLIFRSGHHVTVFAALGAEMRCEKDPAKLEDYFGHGQLLLESIGTEDQQDAWLEARSRRKAPAKPAATPSPVASRDSGTPEPEAAAPAEPEYKPADWVRANFPGIENDAAALADCASQCAAFCAAHDRFPADSQELIAWTDQPAEQAA